MDLLRDSNGDLELTDDGRFHLTESVGELVAQRLALRLASQRGEWHFDPTWGVRYLDTDGSDATVLVKNPNIVAIVAELKLIITSTEDVTRIVSSRSEYDSALRRFLFEFTVLAGDYLIKATVGLGQSDQSKFDPEGSAGALIEVTIASAVCLG